MMGQASAIYSTDQAAVTAALTATVRDDWTRVFLVIGGRMRFYLTAVVGLCAVAGCHAKNEPVKDPDRSIPTAPRNAEVTDDPKTLPTAESSLTVFNHGFVGSTQCVNCHKEMYQSYLQTDHSRSLRTPNLAEELVNTSFEHGLSHRRFEVKQVDDSIIHTELLLVGPEKQTLPLNEKKISFVMGSGAFAKSYLVREENGYVQAPLSFYVGKNEYEMSPGYDEVVSLGFRRQIGDECMFCHAGIVERESSNRYHFQVQELSIGCERCHGPGETHVKHYQANSEATTPPSTGNVANPSKLDRAKVQSICAQCHLQGNVTMYAEGKDAWSFLPGTNLEDIKVEYAVGSDDGDHGFVGHFSQMEQSKCYIESESMTCVSCHDPHHADKLAPEPTATAIPNVTGAESAERQRQDCLQCHQDEQCGEPKADRITKANNQCVVCHMPRGKSEVPHAVTTNHRIGIYPIDPKESVHASPKLKNELIRTPTKSKWVNGELPVPVALLDATPVGSPAREFNEAFALAIWLLSRAPAEAQSAENLTRSIARLRKASESMPTQRSDVLVTIAGLIKLQLNIESQTRTPDETLGLWREATRLAGQVEQAETDPTPLRADAMTIIAEAALEFGQFDKAIARYEAIVRIRRYAPDWYNLGLAYGRVQDFEQARAAFMKAIELDSAYPKPYRSLEKLYRNVDPQRAAELGMRAAIFESIPH